MYCMNCGAFVPENTNQCLNCGTVMSVPYQQSSYYPNAYQMPAPAPMQQQEKIEYPDKEVAGIVFGIFALVIAVFAFILCWIPFVGSFIGAIMSVISIIISLIVKAVLESVVNNATVYSRKVNAGRGLTTASLIICGVVFLKAILTLIVYFAVVYSAGQTGGVTP